MRVDLPGWIIRRINYHRLGLIGDSLFDRRKIEIELIVGLYNFGRRHHGYQRKNCIRRNKESEEYFVPRVE